MCGLSHFSYVQLFATLWTVARQASLSMGFSRPEYWRGLPHPPPGRASSRPRGRTHSSHVSCIGSWVLSHWHHLGSPMSVCVGVCVCVCVRARAHVCLCLHAHARVCVVECSNYKICTVGWMLLNAIGALTREMTDQLINYPI